MVSSIKTKIIAFYLLILSISLITLGMFLYLSLEEIVYDSVDSGLLSKAKALATLVSEDNGETEFKFSDEIMHEYSSSKFFFQIRRIDGAIIEKSTSLGNFEFPSCKTENHINFETILLNNRPLRLISFLSPPFVIQCAEDIQDKIEFLKHYRIILSLSILTVILISTSGGFLIAKKALIPIMRISETINRISESNLSERVDEKNIPSELKGLAVSFNRTFDNLEKAFNKQKQFLSDASHELRTPLSVILSQSEIALRKERSVEEYRNALIAIKDASKIMSNIIERLLTLARLSSDKLELRVEKVDIVKIIQNAMKVLGPLAAQNGISITINRNEPLKIFVDKTTLLEVFINVIDNAIKYNISQGRVDIFIREDKDFAVIEIKDTGIGIPEEDLDKVFDRFYRVDKSRSKKVKGLGLGLSICKEIVRLHGGRIEIESKVGEGTTVSIYLRNGENLF